MGISAGLSAFKLAFELSPIVMQNGIAQNIPGQMLPIIAITESLNFAAGLLEGGDNLDFDDFFAHFVPVPGSTLSDQQIGHYPFANQAVAANAVIADPLTISLRMICPYRGEGGWAIKLATMTALQAAVKLHNASGGTYIVATPNFFYTSCVSRRLYDVSRSDDKQAMNTYQWDFEAPLLTLQDAQQAQSSLMSQITNGTGISGAPSWTGLGGAGGVQGAGAPAVVGSAQGAQGAGTVPAFGGS